MSFDRELTTSAPLGSEADLEALFRSGEKPARDHRLGLEHERLLHSAATGAAAPYEGEAGVAALLSKLAQGGLEPAREGPEQRVVALRRGALGISLEPGGQLELSGSPFRTAREAHQENLAHLQQLRAAAAELGLVPVALGYRPFGTPDDVPWMPRARYQVMRATLPRLGRLARHMMQMTASIQLSLDWSDEADCARKVCLLARLSPLLVALFANSPLAEGRPSGYLSYRARVWDEVDPGRGGYLPSMLDGGFSYRAFIRWALDAQVLFLRRGDDYLDPAMTFRQLLARGWEGRPATDRDWENHVSTLFPEVRIKKVIEVRAPDCCGADLAGGLAALLRGLVYDATALGEAERLLPRLSLPEHLALHDEARRLGLRGQLRGTPLSALAGDLLSISAAGLRRLDPEDLPLLQPLEEVARSGRSPAERVLERFERASAPAALLRQLSA